MGRMSRRDVARLCPSAVVALVMLCLALPSVSGATIVLKDGRRLKGSVGKVSGLADSTNAAKAAEVATITFVDDELRRVFFPTTRVQSVEMAEAGDIKEKISLQQRAARNGAQVHRVGPAVKITPFDDHGHRTFSMMTAKGRLDVVQGITQITPGWTKVEALATQRQSVNWDMRIATTSIDKDQLRAILLKRIDPKDLEQRLKIVRLFLQMDRFLDAQRELDQIIADFPGQEALATEAKALRQLHARNIVKEIEVRRKAGQHQLAYQLLEQFPTEDVAGETLQQVREMLDEYRLHLKQLEESLTQLAADVSALQDPSTKTQCEALLAEIKSEMTLNTLDRLAAYVRLGTDGELEASEKLSLAFSGWLVGSEAAETNLAATLALGQIRDTARSYLAEPMKLERDQIFNQLRTQEGSSPLRLAALIKKMKPPLPFPDQSVGQPGFFEFSIPVGIDKEPDVNYYVQLPPEYDPYIPYPTIVTLNGLTSSALQQIDWWAGERNENGTRAGQASRLGYIVISVDWQKPSQEEYEYSAREHAAVLRSVRDASRRFSIDTDRVFLSGHAMGGNAAWDIGLAHPDMWAGVIPIAAISDKYCAFYWENGAQLPMYVVGGEMDGDKTVRNARDLNRALVKRFDVTVCEYRGRGHEDFYEEIHHIFDWMGRRAGRNYFPHQFTIVTMRPWDNFFWWADIGSLPPKAIVEPENWPPPRNSKPAQISARVSATNGLSVTTGGSDVTLWLAPEMVDFERRMTITVNGVAIIRNQKVEPDGSVLLEDVRTRGDRQHPFWAKVQQ